MHPAAISSWLTWAMAASLSAGLALRRMSSGSSRPPDEDEDMMHRFLEFSYDAIIENVSIKKVNMTEE
jgi:hypothetical protein